VVTAGSQNVVGAKGDLEQGYALRRGAGYRPRLGLILT
jgi:hypothetical protein